MSFAGRWLRYLENQSRTIDSLEIRGKVPEDTPTTTVVSDFGTKRIKQVLAYNKGMRIPNKASVKSVNVNEVVIGTNEGFTYIVGNDRTIVVNHMKSLSNKEKKAMEKEAESCGYHIDAFIDVY